MLAAGMFAMASSSLAVDPNHAASMAESRELFSSQVRGILMEHCVSCHGGEKTKSGFDLSSRERLMKGGDYGEAIVLGDGKGSFFYQVVAHLEEGMEMPPKKPKLPAADIAAIARWIDLGAAYDKPLVDQAKDPNLPMTVSDADRDYWAYAPLAKPKPPKSDDASLGSIDRFIAAGYREKELVPAPELPKEQLIRRAHFDLVGLPPTPAEIKAFVKNEDPKAYEALIDDLLSRPGYGERWGRHWLDVARFAESHGFEHDYDRKHAYHYRDFVIRALNAGMPYDQFVSWQIAGDELAPEDPEAMKATGFLGAGVYPTQITINEAERIRYDALDDMVATMGSAMLATTIGCARCHDHKYDPIPERDYYELVSAFTTTVRSEVDIELEPVDEVALKDHQQKLAALNGQMRRYRSDEAPAKLAAWLTQHQDGTADARPQWTVLSGEAVSAGGAKFERQDDGSLLATGANPDFDTYTLTAELPFKGVRAIRIEALAHESLVKGGPGRASNGNFALSNVKVLSGGNPLQLVNPRASFNQNPVLHVTKTTDDDPKSAWAIDPQFGKDHAAVYEVMNPGAAEGPLTITLKFGNNRKHSIGRFRVAVSQQKEAGLPPEKQEQDPALLAATKLLDLAKQDGNQDQLLEAYLPLDPQWTALLAKVEAHQKAQPRAKTEKVMVCSEGYKPMRHHTSNGKKIPDFYKQSYYLLRGDPAQKDGEASQGFLKVLMRDGPDRWITPKGEARTSMRRTGVAKWLTDTEYGAGHLLARVMANRMWYHHFGRGIVDTPNDFGFQASKPTHPELLEHLATELIAGGWQLKPLHKQIMMSRTYRLGASSNGDNLQLDPANRFWWKRDARRLEAEVIRDNALAVSGLLDRRMFGPGSLNQGMPRRSIYFFVKRSRMIPMMQAYDWPDSLTSMGRRAVTTTASQALVFINSPEVRRMAEHFAKTLEKEKDPIAAAVYRAMGRHVSESERETMNRFLERQAESYDGDRKRALIDLCQMLLASNEMIYVQ